MHRFKNNGPRTCILRINTYWIDKKLCARFWYCDIYNQNKKIEKKFIYISFYYFFTFLNITWKEDLFIKND